MILKVKHHNKIEFFNSFSLLLKYDSVASAVSFSFYFDPNNSEHKRLFQPGHYHQFDVEHNGELLIRGFMISQSFTKSAEKELATIAGYSLCGVWEDCNIPPQLYPLQSDGLTLKEIANKMASLFPFSVSVDSSVSAKVNTAYGQTVAQPTDTIKGYISSLAGQRNIIVTNTPEGNVLLTQAKTKQKPIFHFEDGQPATKISLIFNGQEMHSHITVMKQADEDGGNAGEETIRNPFVPFVYRPLVKVQTSGGDNDTSETARNILSKELKSIVLTIQTNVWELDGKVIKPNSIITVKSPENYIYEKTRFFIESVSLIGTEEETTATLTCVLPEVYNNETPNYFFEVQHDDI